MSDITVAIPTYESDPTLLAEVLGGAGQSDRPVLVVDMSTTDAVAAVAAERPGVSYVRLSGASGVSQSRNEATRLVETRYVLFLDSDAVPEPGWLDAMRGAFEHDGVALAGARVLPAWNARVPPLFDTVTASDWLSLFDLGDHDIEAPRVMGTSYALDLERTGRAPFDETLGRRPGSQLGNEEVQLALDVRSAGWRCWYAAQARVRHHLTAERLGWRWMLGRAYTAGRETRVGSTRLEPLPRRMGPRDHLFRALAAPSFMAGKLRGGAVSEPRR